jgi:MFS family permease
MRFSVNVNGELIIPAYWQSLWSSLYNVTTMLGSVSAGYCQDRFGRRSVFLASIIIAVAGIALTFVSKTPAEFLGGKMTSGFAMGLILAGSQTWVSEIAPLPLRGIALSTYAIMLVSGFALDSLASYSPDRYQHTEPRTLACNLSNLQSNFYYERLGFPCCVRCGLDLPWTTSAGTTFYA